LRRTALSSVDRATRVATTLASTKLCKRTCETEIVHIEMREFAAAGDGRPIERPIDQMIPLQSRGFGHAKIMFGLFSGIDRKPKMHDAYASEPSLIRRLLAEAFDVITGAGYMRQFAVLLASQVRLSVAGMLDASTLTLAARLAKRVVSLAEFVRR
jgi:hypothetical protein